MIRAAAAGDLTAIKNCAAAAYAIYVERIGRAPAPMVADFAAAIDRGEVWVSVDGTGRGLRGYAVFYARDDHVHLENIAVDPACQGQGFGAELFDFVERRTRALGLRRIELYTNAKMTENLELYPRLGYCEFERRVEDGFDRVYFSKTLA